MFSPKVIHDYYQFTVENVVPLPIDFHWNEVAEVLMGRENAWPLETTEWHQIELTPSIAILWFFKYHNIEPISHRTTFPNQTAGYIYHLAQGSKIDLATHIYDQLHSLGTWRDRRSTLILSSLISGICRAAGVALLLQELLEKSSPMITRTIFEAQTRARVKHREEQENELR
ncbi:Hypothetical predicted protein [Olea europaea subsp. europaea]|uniref:Putative plant transposon protein domain-containing protein n=1 Tax=Olea europaea subsp. europaea TaxID=158383 RepID=A0A8S0VFQ2_OLEEU|nr:Hypothetical predicted protein [Olea europaea subsp. europaea]